MREAQNSAPFTFKVELVAVSPEDELTSEISPIRREISNDGQDMRLMRTKMLTVPCDPFSVLPWI